ncbi:MAG: hypothetical protein WBA84_10160 [Carnobacterium sp.]|uniref:hypothetical protein n=1 Tax=Carnobacterium sp. TaxID=48221 RepID=UPI003C75436F
MDFEHVLTTKITIKGVFQDFQLYSGKFYLWLSTNELVIYDWNKWMKHLAFVDRTIYFEPQPTEQLTIDLHELDPFKEKTVSFPEPVYDSAIFDHALYYSDASGFYRFSLISKEAKKEHICSIPFFQINLSTNGRMALSAREKGLFEYLVSSHYLFVEPTVQLTPRLFQLSNRYTARTEWRKHDLIQYGKEIQSGSFLLRMTEKKGLLHFLKEEPIHSTSGGESLVIQELPLPLSLSKPSMDSGILFAFERDTITLKKDPLYRSKNLRLLTKFESDIKKEFDSLDDLIINQTTSLLTVSLYDVALLTLATSTIKKWRIYSRTRNYRNQLHVLAKNNLCVYLFTEVKR